MPHAPQWCFAEFRVDSGNKCLWRGAHAIKLKPRTFDVLSFLVERAGRLVTRTELFAALWSQTYVSETALTNCLSELRKALHDTAKPPRFIETVHRRGYRFIAPIVDSQQPGMSHHENPQTPSVLSQTADCGLRAPDSSLLRPLLVGRESELAHLQHCFDTAQQGERQVVFVTGEPGVGKTTLIEAFLCSQRLVPDVAVGRGQCVKRYGAEDAYLPVFEALGRMGKEERGERLIALLRRYAPTWAAQMPGFLSSPDFDVLPQPVAGASREHMLRELAEALEVFTREQMLVLWLDDLHDSDPSTLDLIAYLARRHQPARLFVVSTYRPAEILSGEHALRRVQQELRERRQWHELALAGLEQPTVEAYLKLRFTGGTDVPFAEFAQVVHRRTEGNPLFVVSVLDDLEAQRVLVQHEGRWQLRTPLNELGASVPPTLLAMLEGQIDNLRPEEQEVLQAASVAGMHFAVPVVSAATGRAVLEVEEICEQLARGERFIQRAGTEDWPETTLATRYRFRHALHQEASYLRIPPMKRADWHRKIGERREKAFAAAARMIAAELAVHFEQGQDFHKAVLYRAQAGENAIQRSAHHEAVRQLSTGLTLLAHWPDTPSRVEQELQLLTILGPALMALKGYAATEVENLYSRAHTLCRQVGETPQLVPVLGGLWVFYQVRAQCRKAHRLAEQVLTLAGRLPDPTAVLYPHMWLGQTLFSLGELRLSQKHLDQSLSLYNAQQNSPRTTVAPQDPGETCLAYTAWTLWLLGYPEQALDRSQRARVLSEDIDHPLSRAHALHFAAWLYHARKEPQAVQDCTETVIRLLGAEGPSYRLAQGMILSGRALVEQGQEAQGIARIQEGVAAWRSTGAESMVPCYLALLAEAYHKAGQAVAGLDTLQRALEHVNKTEERWYEAELYRLKGELTLQNGARDRGLRTGPAFPRTASRKPQIPKAAGEEAEGYFLHAIDIARRQQAKSWELRATGSLCRLWHHQGKRAEAHSMLSDLYNWFTEGFDTADLREAKVLLAELM